MTYCQFCFTLFCFSSQVTGPSFRFMTSSFYKGLTRNPEIVNTYNMFEFCPISEDWGELGIPNLPQTYLIKCYSILQNARVTPFTVSELLRENQQSGVKLSHHHHQHPE